MNKAFRVNRAVSHLKAKYVRHQKNPVNDYFPQPKLRYMEKGFSYEDATIIHECLNKGREENWDYNDAWGLAIKRIEAQKKEGKPENQWQLGLDHPHSNLTGKNAEVLAQLAKVKNLEDCAPIFDVDRDGMRSEDGFYFDRKTLSFRTSKTQRRGRSQSKKGKNTPEG